MNDRAVQLSTSGGMLLLHARPGSWSGRAEGAAAYIASPKPCVDTPLNCAPSAQTLRSAAHLQHTQIAGGHRPTRAQTLRSRAASPDVLQHPDPAAACSCAHLSHIITLRQKLITFLRTSLHLDKHSDWELCFDLEKYAWHTPVLHVLWRGCGLPVLLLKAADHALDWRGAGASTSDDPSHSFLSINIASVLLSMASGDIGQCLRHQAVHRTLSFCRQVSLSISLQMAPACMCVCCQRRSEHLTSAPGAEAVSLPGNPA
jgi:hypothetical protein